MAETVALAGSIIAAIQLMGTVTAFSYEYLSKIRRAPKGLRELVSRLGPLSKVLIGLQDLVNKPAGPRQWLTALRVLNLEDVPLKRISAELEILMGKLDPKKGFRGQ